MVALGVVLCYWPDLVRQFEAVLYDAYSHREIQRK